MGKLKPKQVVEILRSLHNGKRGAWSIGRQHNVSARWVRWLRKYFQTTGKVFVPARPGRKPNPPSDAEEAAVMAAWKKHRVGAIKLKELLKRDGMEVSHHRIHEILAQHGAAQRQRFKHRKRNWVRFERRYSNSLWQMDWTILGRRWVIAIIDDASRLIVGYGEFSNATSAHSVEVLEKAIAQYGKPKAILTGRDVQFYSSNKAGVKQGTTEFQEFLEAQGIKHILARVNHPQTCGKVERFFGTLKQKRKWFASVDELVHWYNNISPHMSLRWESLETPAQAYVRKTRKEKKPIVEEMVIR